MHEHDYEQFTPERVDEQIEALSQENNGTEVHSPNAHLVSNLHEAYTEDKLIVERVWTRLTEQIEKQDKAFPAQYAQHGRILNLPIHERKGPSPMNHSIGTLQKKTHPFQRISTLVAVLFIIALVGSFVVVTRLVQHTPQTGSHTNKTVPAIPQSTLYIATSKGVERVDFKTGKTIWHADSHETGFPVFANDTFYFSGSYSMQSYFVDAVNATNGTLRWHRNDATNFIIEANGLVYDAYSDNMGCYIAALNPSNGSMRWRFMTLGGSALVTIQNGVIYGNSYKYIFAVNAITGVQLWQKTIPSQYNQSASTVPLVSNGVIYFASSDNSGSDKSYIWAYNASNGSEIWHSYAEGIFFAPPAIIGNTLYFATTKGVIYEVDSKTGNILWHYDSGGAIGQQMLVVGDIIYIESWKNKNDPSIIALNTMSKTILWRKQLQPVPDGGYYQTATPFNIYKGLLYAISGAHSIVALSLQDGTQVKAYENKDNVTLYEFAVTG